MLTAGGGVAFLVTPVVVNATGWFGVHAVGGILAVPALLALWWDRDFASDTISEARADTRPAEATPEPSSPLFDRVVLLSAGCYVATLGAYVTLSTFVTAYFDDLGVEVPLNALALFAASLGRGSGGFAVTYPSVDDDRLIAATTGIAAVGLVALAFGEGIALLVLPLVVLGTVSLPFGAIFKAAAVATRRDVTALAVVIAAGNVGALVLPVLTGRLRDVTGTYDAAFLVLATLNALAVVARLAITRRVGE